MSGNCPDNLACLWNQNFEHVSETKKSLMTTLTDSHTWDESTPDAYKRRVGPWATRRSWAATGSWYVCQKIADRSRDSTKITKEHDLQIRYPIRKTSAPQPEKLYPTRAWKPTCSRQEASRGWCFCPSKWAASVTWTLENRRTIRSHPFPENTFQYDLILVQVRNPRYELRTGHQDGNGSYDTI